MESKLDNNNLKLRKDQEYSEKELQDVVAFGIFFISIISSVIFATIFLLLYLLN